MKKSGLADLPEDLLCRIFTARASPVSDPVLDVRDRARCQVVNSQWRRRLRRVPLEQLDVLVSSKQGFTDPQAAWVERSQVPARALHVESLEESWASQSTRAFVDSPSLQTACHLVQHSREVLQELGLTVPSSMVRRFQPALRELPQLRSLSICVEGGSSASLDASRLCQLPSLRELAVGGYESLKIKGRTLAPSLTSLDAAGCGKLDLDATLPHLQHLDIPVWARIAGSLPALSQLRGEESTYPNWIEQVEHFELNAALPKLHRLTLKGDTFGGSGGVLLRGGRLSLPALTHLSLFATEFDSNFAAEVAFERLPALQDLDLYQVVLQKGVKGFSTLKNLTSFTAAAYYDKAAGTVVSLLRAAPPSLRKVDFSGNYDRLVEHGLVEALAGCTQLAELNGRPYSEQIALLEADEVDEEDLE